MTTTLHFTPTPNSKVIYTKEKNYYKLISCDMPDDYSNIWQPVSVILTSDEHYKDGDLCVQTNYEKTNSQTVVYKNYGSGTFSFNKIIAAHPPIPNIPTISESDLPYLIEMGNAGCFDVEVETTPRTVCASENICNNPTCCDCHIEDLVLFEGCVVISRKETVEKDEFQECFELLRDLADLQNDAPLETDRKEWEETMDKVYKFLKKYEENL